MGNQKFGCCDIAKAIQALMTMANISGWVTQKEDEKLRQFSVSSIESEAERALLRLEISNQSYLIQITQDTKNQ